MKNTKILEMINNNQIEELKKLLQDEIYTDGLSNQSNAKKRYSAMKKYFTYKDTDKEVAQKPCKIQFQNKDYISFCNGCSIVLTTEDVGEMELYVGDHYPSVENYIFNAHKSEKETIDIKKIIAEAKSQGYKLKKSDFQNNNNKYFFKYGNKYFQMGLLDASYSIIDDNSEVTIYDGNPSEITSGILLENSIGKVYILPIRFFDKSNIKDKIIIEA